ncbi:hypothetical protein ACWKWK_12250 [Pseudoxanthomonas beigongshangi]
MTSLSPSDSALPLASVRAQVLAGIALALLMIATRGQHFASVNALPSASWAVFFLAGALLRPMWALPAFFLLSSLLDFSSLASGTITDWCMSPAYWALAFAYAALWLGGHVYRGLHCDHWRTLPRLALVLVATASVAYLLSKGGFYFFSGRYPEPTMAGFLARVPHYYPRALGTLAGYVGVAFALRAVIRGPVFGAAGRSGTPA